MEEFQKEYVIMRVNEWVAKLQLLTKIAKFYQQAAYCTFTSGFRHKFNYFIWTIPKINHLLQPIENVIRQKFTTSPFEGGTCNDEERQLLPLPVKLGRMGITNITSTSDIEDQTSKKINSWIKSKIKKDRSSGNLENSNNQQEKFKSWTEFYDFQSKMTSAQLIATSSGAWIWFSYWSLKHERSSSTKREFFDAVLLGYGWELKHVPHECVFKAKCHIDHARICYTLPERNCKCHCKYAINGMQRCKERGNSKHYTRQ